MMNIAYLNYCVDISVFLLNPIKFFRNIAEPSMMNTSVDFWYLFTFFERQCFFWSDWHQKVATIWVYFRGHLWEPK